MVAAGWAPSMIVDAAGLHMGDEYVAAGFTPDR